MGTWTTPPRTWVAGEIPTAAMFNSNLRDFGRAFSDAWTSWTPTISQNGARTITNSSSTYMQAGKLVIARARVVITQAGTTNNVISSSLPVTPLYDGDTSIGSFTYQTTGGTRYAGSVIIWTSSLLLFQVTGQTNVLGIAPNFATANGDIFTLTMTYEAA